MKLVTLSSPSNHIRVMNSTSSSRSRRTRSMERNPGMRRASMPGMTSPRTMRSYAPALSFVVQPRHTRQIMNPEPMRRPCRCAHSARYSRSPVAGSYQTRIRRPVAGSMNTSLVGSEPLPASALFRFPRYRSQPKMAITIPTTTTARITHSTTCMTAPSALRADGVGGVGNRLDDPGGAVGHDLAHGPAHLGRVEAHHGHGVGPHGGGVLNHAVQGLAPGILVGLDV